MRQEHRGGVAPRHRAVCAGLCTTGCAQRVVHLALEIARAASILFDFSEKSCPSQAGQVGNVAGADFAYIYEYQIWIWGEDT